MSTQYQVRVQAEKVEISVREGSVVIRNTVGVSTALAGAEAAARDARILLQRYDTQDGSIGIATRTD